MGSGSDQRWFAVGHSRAEDPRRAGSEAAAAAHAPGEAKLVVVFASCDHDLDPLLEGIRDRPRRRRAERLSRQDRSP